MEPEGHSSTTHAKGARCHSSGLPQRKLPLEQIRPPLVRCSDDSVSRCVQMHAHAQVMLLCVLHPGVQSESVHKSAQATSRQPTAMCTARSALGASTLKQPDRPHGNGRVQTNASKRKPALLLLHASLCLAPSVPTTRYSRQNDISDGGRR